MTYKFLSLPCRLHELTCGASLAGGSYESRIARVTGESVRTTVSSDAREAAEVVARLTFLSVLPLESAVPGVTITAGIAVRSGVAVEASVTWRKRSGVLRNGQRWVFKGV